MPINIYKRLRIGLLVTREYLKSWRRGSPMVRALVSGSSGPVSSPGRGHCVVFLEDTLVSQCLSPSREKNVGK